MRSSDRKPLACRDRGLGAASGAQEHFREVQASLAREQEVVAAVGEAHGFATKARRLARMTSRRKRARRDPPPPDFRLHVARDRDGPCLVGEVGCIVRVAPVRERPPRVAPGSTHAMTVPAAGRERTRGRSRTSPSLGARQARTPRATPATASRMCGGRVLRPTSSSCERAAAAARRPPSTSPLSVRSQARYTCR